MCTNWPRIAGWRPDLVFRENIGVRSVAGRPLVDDRTDRKRLCGETAGHQISLFADRELGSRLASIGLAVTVQFDGAVTNV